MVENIRDITSSADLERMKTTDKEGLKKVLNKVQSDLDSINGDDPVDEAERQQAREILVHLRKLDLDHQTAIESVGKSVGVDLATLIQDVEEFSEFEAKNMQDGDVDADTKTGVLGRFDTVSKAMGISRTRAMIMAQKWLDISSNIKTNGRYDTVIGPKVLEAWATEESIKKYIQVYQDSITNGNSTGSGGSTPPPETQTPWEETEQDKTVEKKKAESLEKIDTLVGAHTDKLADGTADFIKTNLIDETSGELNEKVYNALDGLFHLPAEAWNWYKLTTWDIDRLVNPEATWANLLTGDITWNASKKSIMVPGATPELAPDPFPWVKELFHDIQKGSHNVPEQVDLTKNTQADMENKAAKQKVDSITKELGTIKSEFPWSRFDFTVNEDGDSATITREWQTEVINRRWDYFFTAYSSKPLTLKQAAVMANMCNFTKDYIDREKPTIEDGYEPFIRDGDGIEVATVWWDINFIADGGKWQKFYTQQGLTTDDILVVLNKCYHDYTGK